MSFGSKNTTEQTQTRNPYAAAVPALNAASNSATSYLNDPTQGMSYGGPRVQGMSDMTGQGLHNLGANAGAGVSSGYLKDVVGGQYLNAQNPHLQALTDSIRAQVMPSVNSQFSNAGMVGSSLHEGSIASGMTNALAPQLFNQYNQERQNQQQAAGMLPGVDANAAMNQVQAGQLGEGYGQRQLDANRSQYDEGQLARARQLQVGSGVASQIGQAGGTASGTMTQSSNPGLGQMLLGGAMMAGNLYTGGAMGAGAGAVGGMFGKMNSGAGGGMFGNGGLWSDSPQYAQQSGNNFGRRV